MVELFTLVLSLVLGILLARLGTHTHPLLDNQLSGKLFILLLRCTQGLTSLGAEVDLNPGIISRILNPLFGYKNFLNSLRKNKKGIPCKNNIYIYIYIYLYSEIIIKKNGRGNLAFKLKGMTVNLPGLDPFSGT